LLIKRRQNFHYIIVKWLAIFFYGYITRYCEEKCWNLIGRKIFLKQKTGENYLCRFQFWNNLSNWGLCWESFYWIQLFLIHDGDSYFYCMIEALISNIMGLLDCISGHPKKWTVEKLKFFDLCLWMSSNNI
jgi:hypothetical protein